MSDIKSQIDEMLDDLSTPPAEEKEAFGETAAPAEESGKTESVEEKPVEEASVAEEVQAETTGVVFNTVCTQ
jgi:hypothetical protein